MLLLDLRKTRFSLSPLRIDGLTAGIGGQKNLLNALISPVNNEDVAIAIEADGTGAVESI